MLDKIKNYFTADTGRIITLGYFLIQLGVIMILAAIWGYTKRIPTDSVWHFTMVPQVNLSDLYWPILTWWIPESLAGLYPALDFILLGGATIFFGKRFAVEE